MHTSESLPQQLLTLVNQVHDLERKIRKLREPHSMQRNLERMRATFEELGLMIEDPIGQPFTETRTDCEASIAGNSTEHLVITDVIKPVIRLKQGGGAFIVQKAVVIVQSI